MDAGSKEKNGQPKKTNAPAVVIPPSRHSRTGIDPVEIRDTAVSPMTSSAEEEAHQPTGATNTVTETREASNPNPVNSEESSSDGFLSSSEEDPASPQSQSALPNHGSKLPTLRRTKSNLAHLLDQLYSESPQHSGSEGDRSSPDSPEVPRTPPQARPAEQGPAITISASQLSLFAQTNKDAQQPPSTLSTHRKS